VYIPRAFRRPGRLLAAEHLFRRSGHIVQDRPLQSLRWGDIPQLSVRDAPCLAAWLQSWRPGADTRPSAYQAGHMPSWRGSCERNARSPVAGACCCCCHRCCRTPVRTPIARLPLEFAW